MSVKVRLMEPRLRTVAGVNLHPGLQEVTDQEWKRIQRHPIGASLVERGVIVERKTKTKQPAATGASTETADKPAKAADLVEEIRETYDVHRLRELADDNRVTVSEAATEQLAKIEGL